MGFYDLSKEERKTLVEVLQKEVVASIVANDANMMLQPFDSDDTYIRKAAYQAIGKAYALHAHLRDQILSLLQALLKSESFKVRQTTINAAGEIGFKDFSEVATFFNQGLFDPHPSVRNAVIGSIKKMGGKNPLPVLTWARNYLHHPHPEIRREICHGIELRGRTHPEDILPLLKELQFDKTARVRNTLVHVLGQISYKNGCLAKVIRELKSWENKELVSKAIKEIIDVHELYKDFAVLSQDEAISYIQEQGIS